MVPPKTNALRKNISDKGGAPCTLMTSVCYLYFDACPTSYMIFFGVSLNGHVGAFMFTNTPSEKGNKVCGVPCKFIGHTVGGASRALRMHHVVFFFFFTLKISLNFKF
jgi:hypothetical protein